MVAAAAFYQFSLYSAVRLAHHGFTIGELGIVCFGATVLFMEMMNLTFARVRTTDHASAIYHTNFVSDLASRDPVHQDVPSSDASLNLSARSHPRLPADRFLIVSSFIPLAPGCSHVPSVLQARVP